MKGEVHAATAHARRAIGQQVHVLDLRDDGHEGSLNPLDLVMRSGTDPAALAEELRCGTEWTRRRTGPVLERFG